MKPIGPIPAGFTAIEGELAISGRRTSELVEEAGRTPLFVYSKSMIEQRLADLRAAMPDGLKVNYAIKANSYAPLLEYISPLVDGLDIASGGELEMLQELGIDGSRISFAGPGKRDEELEAAIRAGVTLNLESENEARRALAISEKIGVTPRLAIRVNPDFELKGSGMKMGGGAKPFGIDAERVPALARQIVDAGCDWRGLHIFTGSQALSAEAVTEAQSNILDLAIRLANEAGVGLPKLNMGGGFGIPYFNGDTPLEIVRVGNALRELFKKHSQDIAETELFIELGRYLVGEAGVYLTRIVDRKESHGETYLVTDGGLHHQLAASGNFGTVVRRNYPVAIASYFAAEPTEVANIVGCLCTPLDRLADKAHVPKADVGDIVAVFCAGAYGASASPSAFLGQGPAAELLV
ncbi:pyridoxal-dependent decarboxylase, exosortase A system-associated [Qipengyuania sp. 1NDW9]|uniref:Pyridoxal-dependent decarboxylase, exosortase A system-associated n=1 Tax=Qipengyuania xiapuensis TaxID=2867236 RepID=A0ABX8ZUE1_9SPHN|nr:pyridoxal-dependent decarboxylase, exosortase A system-associated [Qipengyuania xiapuensis]MBX7493221.1 pyridoxal-dependent decarboxylase, exosortase A system-associated [Qipengyuania xiapuensis]QZD92640.1 pyridoxal-dependent decarboxylase, exosortase A system-associated [Qipengyuania xiapuensis]